MCLGVGVLTAGGGGLGAGDEQHRAFNRLPELGQFVAAQFHAATAIHPEVVLPHIAAFDGPAGVGGQVGQEVGRQPRVGLSHACFGGLEAGVRTALLGLESSQAPGPVSHPLHAHMVLVGRVEGMGALHHREPGNQGREGTGGNERYGAPVGVGEDAGGSTR